jgi:hypothetical protein
MVVVRPSLSQRWMIESIHDRVRNIPETNYCAPREDLASFEDFVGWLKERDS